MLEKSFLNPSNQGPVREGIRKLSKFAETLEKSRLSSGFYNTEMGAKSPENNRILLASILGVTFWHFGSYYGELIILKTHTMKSLPILLPILAALVIASCKTQPIAPGETATIKGQVLLATDVNNNGVSGSATPPFNGVQVMLEGTNFSGMTNDSGLYEIDNVPGGTYDVRFSKAGYGEIRWFGKTVQGGGNAKTFWYDQQPWDNVVFPTLYKYSDLTTILDSVSLKDTNTGYGTSHIQLAGHYSGIQSGTQVEYNHEIAIFFSHHSNLSSQPGEYEWYECWASGGAIAFDTEQQTFQIPIDLGEYRVHGFKSGDSVYFAAYGAPNWGTGYPYADYYDPNFREYVLTSINQTPSPVIGLKIP